MPEDLGIQRVTLARSVQNREIVKQVLDIIDRKPVNDGDNGFQNHDLGYAGDDIAGNVANNIQMGVSVYQALLSGSYQIDWYGYAYGAASIPFIAGVGSAFNAVQAVVNEAKGGNDFEVEEVIVTYKNTGWNVELTDLGMTLVNAVGDTLSNVAEYATAGWNSLAGAMGTAIGNIGDALGSFFGWIRDRLNDDMRLTPTLIYGEHDDVLPTFHTIEAGQALTVNELLMLNTNRDHILNLEDAPFLKLGIGADTNSDGVVAINEITAFTSEDSLDLEEPLPGTIYAHATIVYVTNDSPLVSLAGRGQTEFVSAFGD
ncbi:hypothetical protein ABOZ73_08205 [Caulobacter sp. 73W]|uniref:Uncharacterized protein n=1 Tax=Caulobacter sp. 73W TaxID=3161137 RepID=A0AB39KXX6_9CAUL